MLDKKIRRLVKNRPSSRFKNKKYHTVVQLFIPQHDLTILDKKLRRLLRNIASLYGSKNWHSSKSYSSGGPICLAAFKKICIIQGKYLISLHHWETAVEYVQMAWSHVESIPNCDNHAVCKTKQACFKSLALHCKKALTMMISNGLTKKKSKDLLMWMEDAGKQSTAIQPCADVLKEFHSQSVWYLNLTKVTRVQIVDYSICELVLCCFSLSFKTNSWFNLIGRWLLII